MVLKWAPATTHLSTQGGLAQARAGQAILLLRSLLGTFEPEAEQLRFLFVSTHPSTWLCNLQDLGLRCAKPLLARKFAKPEGPKDHQKTPRTVAGILFGIDAGVLVSS